MRSKRRDEESGIDSRACLRFSSYSHYLVSLNCQIKIKQQIETQSLDSFYRTFLFMRTSSGQVTNEALICEEEAASSARKSFGLVFSPSKFRDSY